MVWCDVAVVVSQVRCHATWCSGPVVCVSDVCGYGVRLELDSVMPYSDTGSKSVSGLIGQGSHRSDRGWQPTELASGPASTVQPSPLTVLLQVHRPDLILRYSIQCRSRFHFID